MYLQEQEWGKNKAGILCIMRVSATLFLSVASACALCIPEQFEMELKSVNLEYNTPVCWFAGTNELLTKCLMFQALSFFMFFYRLRALIILYFYLCKFIQGHRTRFETFQTNNFSYSRLWNRHSPGINIASGTFGKNNNVALKIGIPHNIK